MADQQSEWQNKIDYARTNCPDTLKFLFRPLLYHATSLLLSFPGTKLPGTMDSSLVVYCPWRFPGLIPSLGLALCILPRPLPLFHD